MSPFPSHLPCRSQKFLLLLPSDQSLDINGLGGSGPRPEQRLGTVHVPVLQALVQCGPSPVVPGVEARTVPEELLERLAVGGGDAFVGPLW